MNLIVDQGNTFTKIAVFERNDLVDNEVLEANNMELLHSFILKYSIKKAIISSVKKQVDTKLLKKYNFLFLSHETPLPLILKYETPKTLGVDRIAAIVGARVIFPKNNLLVIDIGTCITFDFLDKKGIYWGGSISPGIHIRLKSLNKFTDKLPLVKFKKEKLKLVGNSTISSINSGVYYGIKNEIEGLIKSYVTQYSKLKIVLTGGDANLFDIESKNCIFADKFVVLRGLNEILNYNEKN